MNKLVNCRWCNKLFESERNRVYCSEDCRTQARKQQYDISHKRKKNGENGIPKNRVCPVCNSEFASRHTPYCSEDCRRKASKDRDKEYFHKWYRENRERTLERLKIYRESKKDPK